MSAVIKSYTRQLCAVRSLPGDSRTHSAGRLCIHSKGDHLPASHVGGHRYSSVPQRVQSPSLSPRKTTSTGKFSRRCHLFCKRYALEVICLIIVRPTFFLSLCHFYLHYASDKLELLKSHLIFLN